MAASFIEMLAVGHKADRTTCLRSRRLSRAVNVLASPLLFAARHLIIKRMRAARLPIYQWPATAEEGGLLAYGPWLLLCYRHVVSLVDKVLRGAKPAELPIEQPFKFELVVNLNTASTLGLTIPSALLLRADEVIDGDPCDFRKWHQPAHADCGLVALHSDYDRLDLVKVARAVVVDQRVPRCCGRPLVAV